MAAWTALVGAVVAWTVVLGLGAAAGYGLVEAWGRFGHRVAVPGPVRRGVEALLGAPVGGAAPTTAAAVAPPPVPPAASEPAAPLAVPTPEPPPNDPAALASASPAAAPDPPGARSEPPPPPPEPPVIDRSDAIAETAAVFGLAYEEAVAFVDAGLMGGENFEPWSRAVRGGAPPGSIPDDAFRRVLALAPRDVAAKSEAYRTKRAATRDLETLWGVGPDEAEALFLAGFKDLASIRKASTDKLAKVPGIGAARAFQIRAAAHGLAPAA